MTRIYLAYRKTDAHPDVQRIIDGLTGVHGAAALIKGVQVTAGSDAYRTMVENAIRESAGVVIIVGPEFNQQPDALGRRRLDDPNDPLRIEIEAALKLKKMMIVIAMVGGAMMPDPKDLPRSIRAITRRGAIPMGAVESFEADQSYLNTGVRKMLDGSAARAVRNIMIIFIIVMIASAGFVILSTISANSPAT